MVVLTLSILMKFSLDPTVNALLGPLCFFASLRLSIFMCVSVLVLFVNYYRSMSFSTGWLRTKMLNLKKRISYFLKYFLLHCLFILFHFIVFLLLRIQFSPLSHPRMQLSPYPSLSTPVKQKSDNDNDVIFCVDNDNELMMRIEIKNLLIISNSSF